MSTAFEVWPTSSAVPTFRDVIELAEKRLSDRLKEIRINEGIRIRAWLRDEKPDGRATEICLNDPFLWTENQYVWFNISSVPGGTDAYCRRVGDDDIQMWKEEAESNPNARIKDRLVLIRECFRAGRYWVFRRSASQPAIVNLGYGLVAAAVAELTDGFIISWDSAWDFERFPANAQEFRRVYFRPDQAIDSGHRQWAEQCLERLQDDLRRGQRKRNLLRFFGST